MKKERWVKGGKLKNGETFYFTAKGKLAVEKGHCYTIKATPQQKEEIYELVPFLKNSLEYKNRESDMQRYFAGELRPDQEKSWKADDGIFVLYSEAKAIEEEKDEQIAALQMYKDATLGKESERERQIASLTSDIEILRNMNRILMDSSAAGAKKHADELYAMSEIIDQWIKELEICEYCGIVHPPDQIANPHYCIARLIEESDRLHEAIVLTLNENSRLADGDNCTLWRLKQVMGKRE